MQEIAKQGKKHPEYEEIYNRLFTGNIWDAVSKWDGNVSQLIVVENDAILPIGLGGSEVVVAIFRFRDSRWSLTAPVRLDRDRPQVPLGEGRAVVRLGRQEQQRRLQEYLETIAGYRKTSYTPLGDDVRRKIDRPMKPFIQQWGYAIPIDQAGSAKLLKRHSPPIGV